MNINITDLAKEKLDKLMGESGLKTPALRIMLTGVG